MRDIVLLALSGVSLITGVTVLKSAEQRRLRDHLSTLRLSFPRDLQTEDVARTLAGFSGLLLPWWKRWLASPYVSLEVHADNTGIRHYLTVPEAWNQAVRNILQASVPAVRFEPVETPGVDIRTAAEYRLSSQARPLLIDAAGLSAKLLTGLQPLEPGEQIVVQWLVMPHAPVAPAKVTKDAQPLILPSDAPRDGEEVGALRRKQSSPLLLTTGRIGVRARTGWAELRRLRQIESTWHETRSPGVHLTRRLIPGSWVRRSMTARRAPLSDWPATLNTEELSGLIGWPVGVVAMPGLALGGCRLVPASPQIPSTGTVLADSTFPGEKRPLAVDVTSRLRHMHVLGPTGTGKSTLLVQMAVSDLEAGHGLVLLDPKGDLVQAVLERVPEHRRRDVVVLDPADTSRPVGLNPLRSATGASAEVVVENL